LDSLANFLGGYEVIFIGFESDLKLISCEVVNKILEKRRQKPIFFVDCGIPGNVEQDISKLNNCFLFDLNDLEQYFSREKNNLEITRKENFDQDSFDEEINNYLSSFTKKMNLNSSQVSMFEKYLRLYFNDNLINEEKKTILKFLNFFKK
jgi:glutamyl-tRNA reductase